MVERGTQNVGEGEKGTNKIELKVGGTSDENAKAHSCKGSQKGGGEKLFENDCFDDDDAYDGHVLHDLIKADRIVLQTEI